MEARGETPIIDRLSVLAFCVPTESGEADCTFTWDQTTLVLVEAGAGGVTGLGFTYANRATAVLIHDSLRELVIGRGAMNVGGAWEVMNGAVRNLGRPGISSMAISAVDTALWDLKARLLSLPLVSLLGAVREALPVYGSGGFTNYPVEKLEEQLGGWVRDGIPRVKMKIGRDARADIKRVAAARAMIGAEAQLFVDANAAYSRKQSLEMALAFSELGVSWLEEPVSSDDLQGLRFLCDQGPPGMDIAAGEHGFDATYFHRMLVAEAVDVLQADASRCGGITGFLAADGLCHAVHLPLSSHCAPSLHVHAGCAAKTIRHAEYFFDHARIEQMLFDGALRPVDGALHPDLSRAGHGLEFKHADASRFSIA